MGKTKQYWLLTAVVIVAMLAAGYFLAAKPQADKAQTVRAETEAQRALSARLKTEITTLQKQSAGVIAQQNRLRQISTIVPSTPSFPKLIRSLNSVTTTSGISMDALVPGAAAAVASAVPAAPAKPVAEPGADGGSGTAAAAKPVAAVPASGLNQIPVSLTLSGDFTSLQLFLSKIEKLDRAFVVDALNVTPLAAAASGDPEVKAKKKAKTGGLTVLITGRVFVKAASVVPPAAKAPVAPVSK